MGVKALLGTKVGMTQIFNEQGEVIPVTVISVGPCTVIRKRDNAVSLGYRELTRNIEKHMNKPLRGMFKSADVKPFRFVRDVPADELDSIETKQEVTVSIFAEGQLVDVIGTSKGKGFAGCMERHNFNGAGTTHGQSDRWRAPGSAGSGQEASRTWKGKRSPGHLGDVRKTVKNLKVVKIDEKKNLLLVKGAIPGATSGLVMVRVATR